jgi:flagellar export protein FliJ
MKRYVFSLNRVLRVRATQETVARQMLRTAAEHAAHADEDYDVKLRNYEANVASAASLRGTVLNMLAMRGIATARAEAVVDADKQRDAARAELESAQQTWTTAKQKLGALEKLDERQRAEHAKQLEAEDQAAADDIVTGRARRRPANTPRLANPATGEVPR